MAPTLLTDSFMLVCIYLILFLPLLSFFLCLLTSSRYAWMVNFTAPLLLLTSAVIATFLLFTEWNAGTFLIQNSWIQIGTFALTADFSLFNTTLLMMMVVSAISFLVHLYSVGYMAGDAGTKKYFAMLGFFTFSMQGIVLSDNLLLLFMFWELVGFSSYMLIGHWGHKPAAAKAAQKAFLLNRIGDAGFLAGLMIIWANTGSLSFTEILQSTQIHSWQTAASLCIFCGVIGKSAQFPLFTWLPDAMEGPTPVSALIHAATMVAAGVYLLVKVSPFLTPDALSIVAIVGMITAILGALTALFQYDIKKILAYSTISQLGLMIMALGSGFAHAALLHLFTHAFFKACLFLCAGNVIHALHHAELRSQQHLDVQDIRNMGGLRRQLPVTFLTFAISGASLAGIPFFSGFLSKEAILVSTWMNSGTLSLFVLVTMIGVSFITVLYIFRLLWLVFMGEPRKSLTSPVTEVPMMMRIPVILLALCSLWFTVSWNPFDFIGWLLPQSYYVHATWITVFSTAWIALALVISYFVFRAARFDSNPFFENAFYFDKISQQWFGKLALAGTQTAAYLDKKIDGIIHAGAYLQVIMAHLTGWADKAIIDGTVRAIAKLAMAVGTFTRSFQGGKIQVYIFWAIFGIIIFLIWTMN